MLAHLIRKIAPGKNGASIMPKNVRTTTKPAKFCTIPVNPQMMPQITITLPRYRLGLTLVIKRLLGS